MNRSFFKSAKFHDQLSIITSLAHSTPNVGLRDGKMGILLSLQLSKRFALRKEYSTIESAIHRLQEDISEMDYDSDYSFNTGVFGIGWGVAMLYKNGNLNNMDSSVINSYDDELYKLVVYSKAESKNTLDGPIGRLNYYLLRTSDELKIDNKYRYVLNYEAMILLVDDFTSENDRILLRLNENPNAANSDILAHGAEYTNRFSMIATLVKKEIYIEITEKQKLQFLSSFLNFASYVAGNPSLVNQDRDKYWNTIAVLNCIFSCAQESEQVKRASTFATPFAKQLLGINHFVCPELRHLLLRIYLARFVGFSQLNMRTSSDINYFVSSAPSIGLQGISGLILYLALQELNAQDFIDVNYISYSSEPQLML